MGKGLSSSLWEESSGSQGEQLTPSVNWICPASTHHTGEIHCGPRIILILTQFKKKSAKWGQINLLGWHRVALVFKKLQKKYQYWGWGGSEAQGLATKALGPEINPWYQKARRHGPAIPALWVGVEGTERGRSPGLTGQPCLNRYFQPVRDPVSKKKTDNATQGWPLTLISMYTHMWSHTWKNLCTQASIHTRIQYNKDRLQEFFKMK